MDKTLLIGNGLNRTLKSSISWEDLLDDINIMFARTVDIFLMMRFLILLGLTMVR